MFTQLRMLTRYTFWIAITASNLVQATSGLVSVDASALSPTPEVGPLVMGSSTAGIAPNGDTLLVNNQSFFLNGKPWYPIVGEFHYSRYPADEWQTELLKMKAAGMDAVSTYIIWIHHEETQGNISFSGNCDIARFITLAQDVGLKIIARLGPYAHAEVRDSGLPDWVMTQSAVIRSNDPIYMGFVKSFWTELALQINSTIFKHGGPIIAVQLENEYNLSGTTKGANHITALKSLAVSLGFDVPLYTVTGWDNTVWSANQVVPVFGSYQDSPWGTSLVDLAPGEGFLFRFYNRASGGNGYSGDTSSPKTSIANLAAYPFFSAEYGGGTAPMYRRRVVVSPDDIASLLPVQIGSGINLWSYYMFHGGVNPTGKNATMQETESTGSYNDLAVVNYDYQSPLGQYGQQAPSLNRIKPFHYWLNEFGSQLAPMSLRVPTVVPTGTNDLATLRWSVRSNGTSGYLFVNNYVRQHPMAAQTNIQFAVTFSSRVGNSSIGNFSSEIVTFPEVPITISSGAYFIWPLNLAIGDAKLAYATVQLITSVADHDQTVYFFLATAGIPVEFAFESKTVAKIVVASGTVSRNTSSYILTSGITPGLDAALDVVDKRGCKFKIVVLDQATADNLWNIKLGGKNIIVLTNTTLGLTSNGFELATASSSSFKFSTFPSITVSGAVKSIDRTSRNSIFTTYTGNKQTKTISLSVAQIKAPGIAPPLQIVGSNGAAAPTGIATPIGSGGPSGSAKAYNESVITTTSGRWSVDFSLEALASVNDAWLLINYQGDQARLYAGDVLLDDHFYNGQTWLVGLKRISAQAKSGNLTLAIMPIRRDAKIYLQTQPTYNANNQSCAITNITISTVYSHEITVLR